MTSITLLGLLVAGAAGYVSWASHSIARGAPVWWFILGAPVVYFAPAVVLVAIWSALTWFWRTPRPPEAQIGLTGTLRLFFVEVWTLGASWPLMALHRLLLRDPPPTPSSRPVLLIHGVLVNDGVWLLARRCLARRGVAPIYTINYGPPSADIERFAEQLAGRIDGICAATGAERVILVGHSMGGLVARAYLRRHGHRRVAKIVTIGTPHHGSVLAWSFPGRGLEQMRPGNAWLAELNRDEDRSPVPIVSIWSRHDSMVAPQASSVLACAENVAVIGVGHNAMLAAARILARVAHEIGNPRAP
jgi:triacylglycerol esterase/lipase EstA (alpha/beta hydrolase family)